MKNPWPKISWPFNKFSQIVRREPNSVGSSAQICLRNMAKLCRTPSSKQLAGKGMDDGLAVHPPPGLTCLRRAEYLLFCGYFVYLRIFANVHVPKKIFISHHRRRGVLFLAWASAGNLFKQNTYWQMPSFGKYLPELFIETYYTHTRIESVSRQIRFPARAV